MLLKCTHQNRQPIKTGGVLSYVLLQQHREATIHAEDMHFLRGPDAAPATGAGVFPHMRRFSGSSGRTSPRPGFCPPRSLPTFDAAHHDIAPALRNDEG